LSPRRCRPFGTAIAGAGRGSGRWSYSLPPLADEYQLFMVRLPYYLTLMPEYAHTNVFTIFVHSWIIGIETKFYVFFPLVVFLLIKSDAWRFGATAVTAALLIAQGSFTAHAYCAILAGVILAQLLEWPAAYAVIATLTRVPAAVPLGFVVALFVMVRYVEVLPAVAVVATYLVAHVTLQEGVMRRVLTYGPLSIWASARMVPICCTCWPSISDTWHSGATRSRVAS
jgi:peptidoglycan/LPS O-acetylase OafA/YrhL